MKFSQAVFALMFVSVQTGVCEDWAFWGKDANRNMSTDATGAPTEFSVGEFKDGTEEVDMSTTKNIKWVAKLGSQSYGNVTVKDGKVYVGTNNDSPRFDKIVGDYSLVYCLDENDGSLIWQFSAPKLGAGKVSDWEYLGICSSPAVEGDRVYFLSNLCEIVCVDVNGMKDGNQGFQDEGSYMAGPGNPPIEVGDQDADIIWTFNMTEELGVFPHNITSSSVLVLENAIVATTSNGQDWSHSNIPSPFAPSLCMVDKETGELIGEEASGISENLMHCNWSSPSYGEVDGQGMIFFGAGDGYLYSFDPEPVEDEDGYQVLKENWKVNCVPKEYFDHKYPAYDGPSEIICTPVFYEGKVYVGIGQDPEHGDGVGNFVCVDAKSGDVVWENRKVSRTISTASIVDDLIYIADYAGVIHCIDANTGETYWEHDSLSHMWSSTLVVDDKVYFNNEDGYMIILKAGKEKEMLTEIDLGALAYSTPVFANGVLYTSTQTHLYAVK